MFLIMLIPIGKIPISKWVNVAVTKGLNLILLRPAGITLEIDPVASCRVRTPGGAGFAGCGGLFLSSSFARFGSLSPVLFSSIRSDQLCLRVSILQDLREILPRRRQRFGAPLAHPDSVAITVAIVKRHRI